MAIKGKKKAQRRGSQARRHPAAAPRTTPTSRRIAWYQTPAGLIMAGLLGAAVVAIIITGIVTAFGDTGKPAATPREQNQIDTYTGKIRGVTQSVSVPASEMAAV